MRNWEGALEAANRSGDLSEDHKQKLSQSSTHFGHVVRDTLRGVEICPYGDLDGG